MSILIKGVEIPKEGFVEVLIRDDGTVQQTGQSYRIDGTDYWTPCVGEMPVIYKAVPVPPHEDLIDRGSFIAEQQHLYCENCVKRKGMKNGKMKFVYDIGDAPCRSCGIMDVLDSLEDAPTIIPAEPPKEE